MKSYILTLLKANLLKLEVIDKNYLHIDCNKAFHFNNKSKHGLYINKNLMKVNVLTIEKPKS